MSNVPRPDVVRILTSTALSAMEESNIVDITIAEVVSASFTMCKQMTEVLLANSEPDELERNRNSLIDAIGEIYGMVEDGMIKH